MKKLEIIKIPEPQKNDPKVVNDLMRFLGKPDIMDSNGNLFVLKLINRRLNFLEKIRPTTRRRLKIEKSYSEIGNLLAKQCSLKKFLKKILKKNSQTASSVLAAAIHLDLKHEHISSHMFLQRALLGFSGYGRLTFGSVASPAIPNGTKGIVINPNLRISENLLNPLNNSIIKSKT